MDRYPTINWNTQVCCGRGGDGRDDQSYAVKLSQQLVAVGKWDGRGTLIVHEPQNTLRHVQQTHRGGRIGSVDIYVGIYSMVEGEDYQVVLNETGNSKRADRFNQCKETVSEV